MPDMIVRLYDLPALEPALAAAAARGVAVRPARVFEQPRALDWARTHFAVWVPEIEAAFHRMPVSCLIAVRDADVLGFAAYDATCRNFFGPTGVMEGERGNGLGRALLLAALHAQRALRVTRMRSSAVSGPPSTTPGPWAHSSSQARRPASTVAGCCPGVGDLDFRPPAGRPARVQQQRGASRHGKSRPRHRSS